MSIKVVKLIIVTNDDTAGMITEFGMSYRSERDGPSDSSRSSYSGTRTASNTHSISYTPKRSDMASEWWRHNRRCKCRHIRTATRATIATISAGA